jgi:Ca-activated chloride channel family protein
MNFQFATPWLLTLLIIVPVLAIWHWRNRAAKPATLHYAVAGLAKGLPGSWRITWRPLLTVMRLLTITLLVIGLSRPQIGHAREVIKGEGVEIALAMDISGSMAALDFEPENRLQAAKQVIGQFIGERPYDKIGLVIFSNEAYAQSPLTLDHTMLQRSLEQVELATDLGLEDGTAIGLGLANAANMLTSSEAESKVVILLTDGVNNAGQIDPLTAAEAAKALGIKVYTIATAKAGQVPFPVETAFGTQISYQESQIDEDTLRQVAEITGGQYFRAEDSNTLAQIYEQINQLEKSQVEIQVYNQYQEMMIWLVLPAALLFVVEMLLRKTVFRTIP